MRKVESKLKKFVALILIFTMLPVNDFMALYIDAKADEISETTMNVSDTQKNTDNNEDTEVGNTQNELLIQDEDVNTDNKEYENLTIKSNYTLNENLIVANLTMTAGTLNLNGYKLTVNGDYTQSGGTLNFNNGVLLCNGSFKVSGKACVVMEKANDFLYIENDITIDNAYSSGNKYTNGIIEVKGNFTANTYQNFVAGGYHKVIFSGVTAQSISIYDKNSFNIIELKNYSDYGVTTDSIISYADLIRNDCIYKIKGITGGYGFELTQDTVIDNDYYLIDGEINLNGYTLTVNGDLIQATGSVNINGGRLIVGGDYRLQSKTDTDGEYGDSYASLIMNNEADSVCVYGDFYCDTRLDTTGSLTAGTLEVRGDFRVTDTYSNKGFVATGSHLVLLSGDEEQTLEFKKTGSSYSRICNLEIRNTGEDGINITGKPYVSSKLKDNGCKITGYVLIGTSTVFEGGYFGGDVYINETATLDDEIVIGGNLYTSAGATIKNKVTVMGSCTISSSGSTVFSNGQLIIYGNLNATSNYGITMSNAADYLLVYGDVNYSPKYSSAFSAGTFEIKGNLVSTSGINATGTHRFLFSGDSRQIIDIASNETMAVLELNNSCADGVVAKRVFNKTTFIRNDCVFGYEGITGEMGFTLGEDMVYEGDLYLVDDILDLNGYTLTVTGDLIQSSGTVYINGGTLKVQGDYRIQSIVKDEEEYIEGRSKGILNMTDPLDYVLIYGDFIDETDTNHTGLLTDGVLEVKGNFTINDVNKAGIFVATDNHKLILSGDNKQVVNIYGSGAGATRLSDYETANTSDEGVYHTNSFYVTGNVNDRNNKINGCISIGGTTTFADNYFSGGVYITGSTEIKNEFTIAGNVYNTGNLQVTGKLNVLGSFSNYSSAYTRINGGTLIIHGDLSVSSGQLVMQNENSYCKVCGNVNYSSTYCSLSAGTIEILGNLTSTGQIYATGTHRFLFSGTDKQIIDITSNSYFAILELNNHSKEGVISKNILSKTTFIANGSKFSYEGIEGEIGFTLEEDMEYEGDFVLVDGTLDLNGHTLVINGNLIQAAGEIDINGGSLLVKGDYRIESRTGEENAYTYGKSTGVLRMTGPSDYVCVNGSFITNSSINHTDCLTDGILEVKADFLVKDDYSKYNFISTDNHKVVFSGNIKQTVTFEYSHYNYSRFANIELKEGTVIELVGRPYVSKSVCDNAKSITGYLNIGTNTGFANNKYSGSVYIAYGITFNNDLTIGGDLCAATVVNVKSNVAVKGRMYCNYYRDINIYGCLTIYGDFDLNGSNLTMYEGKLIVKGNAGLDGLGKIVMEHEADYIHVYGDVDTYMSPGSKLSAGTIEISGNLTSRGGIKGVGTHRFLFSGNSEQIISITSDENFAIMELQNYSEDGVYSKSTINKDKLIANGCNLFYGDKTGKVGFTLSGDMEYEGEFILVDETLDLNGYSLNIDGDLVIAGGSVCLNGGTLTVNGDLRIQNKVLSGSDYIYEASSGILYMNNDTDRVIVTHSFIMEPKSAVGGTFNAGTLELYGNFTQKGQYGYLGGENNTIIFKGNSRQTVDATASMTVGSFENSNEEALVLNQGFIVYGTVTDNGLNISGNGKICINSTDQLKEEAFSGNLTISGKNTLSHDLYVDGDLIINSELHTGNYKINAANITVNAPLYIEAGYVLTGNDLSIGAQGMLIMDKQEGYVLVGGNFTTDSNKSHDGYLTDGTLEIKGNMSVMGTGSFVAGGNHIVHLSNKKTMSGRVFIQAVEFLNNGTNKINTLILNKEIKDYQFSSSPYDMADNVILDIEDTTAPSPVSGITVEKVSANSITIRYQGAEDETGVAGYEIYRNGSRLAITSADTYVDSGVNPDTTYTYEVYPFDEYKNVCEISPEITVRTEKDIEAPSAPYNLHITNKTGSTVTLKANASYDNVGVAYYNIYRNNELIAGNITDTVYKDSGLAVNTVYDYYMVAVDTSGNESAKSNIVTATVTMPQITEISPKDYSTIGSTKVTLTVKFKNECNSVNNKVKIEYLNEKNEWCPITPNLLEQKVYNSTTLYVSYIWNVDTLSVNGENTIRYTLYDEEGNTATEYYTYFVDRQAPEKIKDLSALSDNGVIKLNFDPSVSSDCTAYNLYRKEEGVGGYTFIAQNTGIYNTTFEDRAVETGKTYYYVITSLDKFGNESEYSDSVKTVADIDNIIPDIDNILPGGGRINKTAVITVTASDNKSVDRVILEYRKEDEESWTSLGEMAKDKESFSCRWDTTALADGVYIVRAIAIDSNNNYSDGTFTRRYTVDNTGISKINITKYTVNSTGVSIYWEDVTENDFAYFQVEQLVNGQYVKLGTQRNVLGYNVTGLLPDTDYSFRVVGYDNLGNRGTESDVLQVTTGSDSIKPVITSINPISSYYKNTINLSVSARDNVAVSYAVFSYSLDKENYKVIDTVYADKQAGTATISKKFDITDLPEGSIYVKFEVYDIYGNKNALLENGEEIVVEYVIDRTAPTKIENLITTGNEGYIGLNWDAGKEEDIKSYRIYRADADTGVFKVLVANCTTKNYYDTQIDYGKSYIYRISAVDIAGNEGEPSQEVYITVADDLEAPVITGMLPYNEDTVGKNPTVKALVMDNAIIDKIILEYKPKDLEEEVWTEIKSISVNSGSYLASAKWNTEGLEDGEYLIRSYAADKSGNVSDIYQVSCTLKQKGLAAPVISAETGDYRILLDISETTEEEFSHYVIYRKKAGDTSFTKLVSTYDNTYEDKNVEINQVYCYCVGIVDIYGNENISEQVYSYANDTDITPPEAVLPENLLGMVGMEMAFDALASTDNVRITEYKWNMGNGDIVYGAKPIYTYDTKGVYTVSLTVKDEAGNEATTTTTVQILERTGKGISTVKIVDENGSPIPYALVYVEISEEEHLSLKADSRGIVTIAANIGTYRVAAYSNGYLPDEINVHINQYETKEYTLSLVEDELIVGELTVKRMNLQEMVEAGVDFSSPDNYNTYSFSIDLGFIGLPIPERVVLTYGMGSSTQNKGKTVHVIEDEKDPSKNKKVAITVVSPGNPVDGEKLLDVPMVAYMSTGGTVSWLKEMYNVELGILNAADSKYCIKDSYATLNLPEEGLSLADTVNGQELTQSMGDIYGQENKSVSWVVRGDKSGSYKLTADFEGTLMPFDTLVKADFETEEDFVVKTGSGITIIANPEKAAYLDDMYYVHYSIINGSGRTLYNFVPYLSMYKRDENEDYREIVVNNPNLSSQAVLLEGGQRISIPVFYAGEKYTTIAKSGFAAAGDPEKEYYLLVGWSTNIYKGEDLGVSLIVKPTASHTSRVITKYEEMSFAYGDPVDITSGAFTDEYSVLSVNGATKLSIDLTYDSRITSTKGSYGYGWHDDYEISLKEENGIISYYANPSSVVTFVNEKALNGETNGTYIGDRFVVDDTKDYSYGDYIAINTYMADYRLTKYEDDTYTLKAPNLYEYHFNSNGQLITVKDNIGKSIRITYNSNEKILTEDISGKRIKLSYNEEGLITGVTDDNGRRATLAYDAEGNLTSITNVLGETIHYSYDENHRIVEEKLNNNKPALKNEYDYKGRVTTQTDAGGNTITFEYQENPLPKEALEAYEENGEKTYEEYIKEISRYI
ncbi:MAG: PKD domain-containing protein, partial [Lachnospiraceae bacterium]|nr:PKD domain-containing protein [Lachnospiraceae bacterium]